jgi:hypothetical protein
LVIARRWLLLSICPFGLGDVDNFGEVTIDPRGLTVRIYDASGTLRFQHMFAPDDPS